MLAVVGVVRVAQVLKIWYWVTLRRPNVFSGLRLFGSKCAQHLLSTKLKSMATHCGVMTQYSWQSGTVVYCVPSRIP